MCGIVGVVGIGINRSTIHNMLMKQNHRGPDALEIYQHKNINLGHNRLSIIDLSTNANQPMLDPSGRYCMVFNGEIYNYIELKKELSASFTFRTQSDSEVLLYGYIKWGAQVLDKLNGMFAFAIWDHEKQELFAARDRFGVKPFYYVKTADHFIFASEISSILESGLIEKEYNNAVWSSYFVHGTYGNPEETFYKNVQQLPASHQLTYTEAKLNIKKWYHFSEEIIKIQSKTIELDKEAYITELFNKAINLRFRADVPVGFNISGGLDSSMLLALIKNQNIDQSKIHAFTFSTNDARYDETPWVKGLLENTHFPLHECVLESNQVPDLAQKIAQIQMEPFGGIPTIAYHNLFEKASSMGVKVLLDGQGSDEAWAGYDYYVNQNNSLVQGVTKSPYRKQVLNADFANLSSKSNFEQPFEDALLNLQYRDLFNTKIPRALRFNDRMSMMHGTELREPFLDHELVSFVFAQPKEFKIQDGVQKWFLRKLATKYLNASLVTAPKRPLQTPQREWLSEDLKEWVTANVLSLKDHPWFDGAHLEQELDRYYKGDNESSFHIWQWINTALIIQK